MAKPPLMVQSAVRFAAIYFTLIFFPWPFSALLVSERLQKVSDFVVSGVGHAWKPLVDFAAANIFHVGHPVEVSFTDTGSSDRLFDWLVNFWVLVIAALVTAVWAATKPGDSGRTGAYLRVFLRYTLGAVLLTYGSIKLNQFPPPFNTVLNKSIGEETPMGLLWTFIGTSTGYTVAIGLLEVLCGALLFFRRTTLLGACLAFAVTFNIFLLNVFYDVPVKLFSFHLLVASLILLGPDLGRLMGIFVLNRAVPARTEEQGSASKPVRIAFRLVKLLFVVTLVGMDSVAAMEGYAKRTAPPLAISGIWKVVRFVQFGAATGGFGKPQRTRWQWLTVDKFGDAAFCHLWLEDGSVASGLVRGKSGPVLTFPEIDRTQVWGARLIGVDELEVDGALSGVATSVRLRRADSWVSLVGRKLHWIQEAPREP